MKIIALTGAGISAESGIKTFRDYGGLWDNYRVEDVASPIAWSNNPQLVCDFYNMRRRELRQVTPNNAHYQLSKYNIPVITQNVDDLHERSGSENVLHLHGELNKARTEDGSYITDIHGDLDHPTYAPNGKILRPAVVWFGEDVPLYSEAETIVQDADVLLVVGTSLSVYPAAGLLWRLKDDATVYVVDPHGVNSNFKNLNIVEVCEPASTGVEKVLKTLLG